MNIDQIAREALQLDTHDRTILAETIWESLENLYVVDAGNSDGNSIRLAKQRDDEIANHFVEPLSHKELMGRLYRNED